MAETGVTIISVRGEAEARRIAERATVSLAVSADGPDRSPVVDAVSAAAAVITAQLAADHDPSAGPVTRWRADRLSVWSHRPWNQEGVQLPPVFNASISITAEFSDVEALSRFVETASRTEHVGVGAIHWDLTEASRRELDEQVRTEAVHAAVEKARQFAAAAGLHDITPIALADPGLLGDASRAAERFDSPMQSKMMAMGGAESAFEFTPGEIVVAAAVDARFAAS